ncbi:MAG: hypothetical protein U0Q16_03460 [Bryobacteraceae bacterium]
MKWTLLFCIAAGAALAEVPFADLAKLFENGAGPAPALSVSPDAPQPKVKVYDFSFASPVAGRVPGTLVTPARKGKFPVILFGHWMMAGSPMRHRGEFLEEAVILAKAGSVCLLLDAPLVRPGVVEDADPMNGQGVTAAIQMAREWRRALDLLLARTDTDSRRVAYVGHSFNAGVGAQLAAVEKRIQSFVLMANTYSLRDYIYDDENPTMVTMRKSKGEAWIGEYFDKFPTAEVSGFAARSAPAAIFLQNGRLDKPLSEHIVRKTFTYFKEPKRLEFYDAGHELDAKARTDRVAWLQEQLRLGPVDQRALDAIPKLR